MSKLDELIAELCPDGVEYYSFLIFFDEIKGMGGVSNKWAEKGNCRFIDYLNAYKNLSIDVNNLPYATVKNSNQDTLKKGDILFTSASEVPNECAIASAIEDDIEEGIFLDDHLFGLRPKTEFSSKIITGYLKHYFHTIEYRKAVLKAVRGVTRFYISKPDFMKIVFPVPPLPVQEEIVRILDKFTSLTAELTAELTARRKQYEYYRDALLTPPFGSTGSPTGADISTGSPAEKTGSTTLTERNSTTLTDRREHFDRLTERNDRKTAENSKVGEPATIGENVENYMVCENMKNDEVGELVEPTGLVYKKLGEIAEITRGGNFQKKDFVEKGFPCIHYGQMYTHFGTWTDKTLTFVSKDIFEKSKKAQPNDIVMAVTSENVEDVCKCTAWVGSDPIAVSGHTAIIHHNQNAKYLAYYFQSSSFYAQKVKLAHGTKVIEVTPDKLKEITIPLPPLSVQQRIVNVLDNFDAICSDLKIGLPAEIDARKKQYEYYRDLLLTFAERGNTIFTEQNRTEQNRTDEIKLLQYVFGYAIVRLGDVAKIKNGKDYKSLGNGNIPVYGSGGIMTYVDKSVYNKPTVLIPRKGSLSNLFYVDSPFWNVDTIFYTEINDELIVPKYLYYLLSMLHLEKLNKAGGVPSLTQEILNKIELKIPPLAEQERIVKILDRFDELVASTGSATGGIPAEIEARHKQYEYYRDKLLAFKKL